MCRPGRGRTVGAMGDRQRSDEDRILSVRLEVHLDRQPISGRLRSERGAVEPFVGWLGFVEALRRLHESRERSTGPATRT
jgi:hypothetical protein